MRYLLTSSDVQAMLEHWKSTKANSYRGSSYGNNNAALILRPMSDDIADDLLDKIKADILPLANLGTDQLNIYSEDIAVDKKRIYVGVGWSIMIALAEIDTSNYTGDTINANAR